MYSGPRHLGYGFVNFDSSCSAFKAINALNGSFWYGRQLHVSIKLTKEEMIAKRVSVIVVKRVSLNYNLLF